MRQNLEYLHLQKEIQCAGKEEAFWQVFHHLKICGLQDQSIMNKRIK